MNGEDIVLETDNCFAIYDSYPVSHGHMLIMTKGHKETIFDLSYQELEEVNILMNNCKSHLDSTLSPDGYNIGVNAGSWAGQTIHHFHMHIIPRFAGDVPATELRGGIRNFKKTN